jgi:hypothetical protein
MIHRCADHLCQSSADLTTIAKLHDTYNNIHKTPTLKTVFYFALIRALEHDSFPIISF